MPNSVLFVDDNPVILKTIEVAFAQEPYTILLAESGEDGLALVRAHHPQVIVTDLRMPGMNGLEFLKKARETPAHFIGMIFTAYMDIDSIMQAVSEESVWRYIAKPWQDNRELIFAVHNALQLFDAMEAKRHSEEQLARTERLAALGQLVTGIAHQFNNINVGILGYTQMAKTHKDLPDDLRDHLDHIQIFATRGSQIVKELAAFSDQSLFCGFARTDLGKLVDEAVRSLTQQMRADGVEVERRHAAIPDVEVNHGLIKQVVTNLISNAWHATLGKKERKVVVETGVRTGLVFVRVSDTGCGIAKEYIHKIFDPFYTTKGAQAEPGSSQAAVPGVGLGLSLSQTIAQNHSGSLTAQSELGKGSQFTLWLPAAKPEPETV